MVVSKYITFIITSVMLSVFSMQVKAIACGDHLYSDLRLEANLHCPGSPYALKVMADNITIDLNHFFISGSGGGSAIQSFEQTGLTVNGSGGGIIDFSTGIVVLNGSKTLIHDIIFYELNHGIQLGNEDIVSDNNRIFNNQFIRMRAGISLVSNRTELIHSQFNKIENNEMYHVSRGIYLCGVNDSSVNDNFFWKTSDVAIHLNASQGIDITSNDLIDFDLGALNGDGIVLDRSANNNIKKNLIENANNGISFVSRYNGHICAIGESVNLNEVLYNSIFNNQVGLNVGDKKLTGLGISVDFNRIKGNKIYNNEIGIFFQSNTYRNDAQGNAIIAPTPVIDFGTFNTY